MATASAPPGDPHQPILMISSCRVGMAAALVLSMFGAAPLAADCTLDDDGRAWIQSALEDWDVASREFLELEAAPLPWMVFIDTACVWHVAADARGDAALAATLAPAGAPLRFAGGTVDVRGVAHGGTARLPGGQEVPAAPLSFAAPYGDEGAFFVIGMPSVWMRDPRHAADPGLGWLINAVFVHEMTHTRQVGPVYRRIDSLAARVPDPESLDDDVIQKRFDSIPGFRESVDAERDLLYRAAAEPDADARRRMIRDALATAADRRARWLSGGDGVYRELDDVFLNMEGAAQWAAYQVALRRAGPDADPREVLTRFRRGGRFWSQDLGLGWFLAADAYAPRLAGARLRPGAGPDPRRAGGGAAVEAGLRWSPAPAERMNSPLRRNNYTKSACADSGRRGRCAEAGHLHADGRFLGRRARDGFVRSLGMTITSRAKQLKPCSQSASARDRAYPVPAADSSAQARGSRLGTIHSRANALSHSRTLALSHFRTFALQSPLNTGFSFAAKAR
jgi:hypothetical protein